MSTTNSNDESFLDRPYAQASLRDRLRFEDYREERSEPFDAAVRAFLGLAESEIADQRSTHPPYDVPQINFALESCFADWTLVKQAGDWHSCRRPWTPINYRVEISPGEFRHVVREGTWFYELPSGQRRVISLERFSHERDFDLTVLFPKSDAAAAREQLIPFYDWIDERHYLKGQTIQAGGTLIAKSASVSWDEVDVADAARRAILDNVRQFLALGDLFAKNGVPHRRGLLLYGPPGNGKTLIGRVIAATEPATFLYVTAADADNLAVLREAFALARRLKPTIVFLEDLDLYASDRRGSADCQTLGEILAQLDGLGSAQHLVSHELGK